MKQEEKNEALCSFCHKSSQDVGKVVEGPGNVYICEECVELCRSIFKKERLRHYPDGEEAVEANERKKAIEKIETCLRRIKEAQQEAMQLLWEYNH